MRVITCQSCGFRKYEDKFYKSNKSHCKECVKTRAIEYRWQNIDKVREYDRERGQLEHRKDANKRRRSDGRYERHKRAWAIRNPEKRHAYSCVEAAIKSGKLVKPKTCEHCSRDYGLHAHHDDYSKPLEVRWLCAPCHGERHRELNAIKRMAAE